MSLRARPVTSVIVAGLAIAWAVPALAFRCGTHLVREGDTAGSVIARCGEPHEVDRKIVLRPAVTWLYGRPYRVGNGDIEVAVETWIYNLGPNKFMRRVKIEDGLVVEIDTLGYGYH